LRKSNTFSFQEHPDFIQVFHVAKGMEFFCIWVKDFALPFLGGKG